MSRENEIGNMQQQQQQQQPPSTSTSTPSPTMTPTSTPAPMTTPMSQHSNNTQRRRSGGRSRARWYARRQMADRGGRGGQHRGNFRGRIMRGRSGPTVIKNCYFN